MSSQVRYRFKNAVAEDTVAFDGAVIQVGDVKRLIALKRGLGAEGAAELTLLDPGTNEEHVDEAKVLPRNTLVLVKRAPAARFKPLSSAAGGAVAPSPAAAPAPAAAAPAAAAADEFGGELYSERPTAALVQEKEDQALKSLLQSNASTWQREVRQGVLRGRGRGRGAGGSAPFDYRCPRWVHGSGHRLRQWAGGSDASWEWSCWGVMHQSVCSTRACPAALQHLFCLRCSHRPSACAPPPPCPGVRRWASTGCRSAPPRATRLTTRSACARPSASP